MRCATVSSAVGLVLLASPVMAQTIHGDVSFQSSYIDLKSFNDRFSPDPVIQFTGTLELGRGLYVEPYVYTGFHRPFRDQSSEYGAEIGWEADIGHGFEANFAAGRWANYQGMGLHEGDWFGRVGVSRGDLDVSASLLRGVDDTVLLNAEYSLKPTTSLRVTPKIAYLTAGSTLNLGVEVSYEIAPHFFLQARMVAPTVPENDHLYGSIGAGFSF